MYLDITIKQLPQGVIHFFLNRRYGSAILSPSHVVTDEECNNQ